MNAQPSPTNKYIHNKHIFCNLPVEELEEGAVGHGLVALGGEEVQGLGRRAVCVFYFVNVLVCMLISHTHIHIYINI